MQPYISICIPAFKNYTYLRRLLESIKMQNYPKFEVVITDDNPGEEIKDLCSEYEGFFELNYFKNPFNLNTPENWNESVRRAKYDWIKIMHDDDWFSVSDTLSRFAEAIIKHPNKEFFFSAYQNIYDEPPKVQVMKINKFWNHFLNRNIEVLIAQNVIGPPSVTLYKKNHLAYDSSMKYVVDIDFYSRYCVSNNLYFVPQVLVNVGIHADQVTKYTHGIEDIHLKESILMLNKKTLDILKNILVFDGWWRLLRNFKIDNTNKLTALGMRNDFIPFFAKIISIQQKIPNKFLKNGFMSKMLMSLTYLYSSVFR